MLQTSREDRPEDAIPDSNALRPYEQNGMFSCFCPYELQRAEGCFEQGAQDCVFDVFFSLVGACFCYTELGISREQNMATETPAQPIPCHIWPSSFPSIAPALLFKKHTSSTSES